MRIRQWQALPSLTLLQKLRLQWGRWNLSAASRWLTRIAYLIVVFSMAGCSWPCFAGQRADAVKRGGGHR